jgi:hypothetical protein
MRALALAALAACSAGTSQLAPDAPAGPSGIPDIRCASAPDVPAVEPRHHTSDLIADLGEPRHRGIDLIAAESDRVQILGGALAYTQMDKAIEDEDVRLFACTGDAWRSIGTARTDDEGRFSLALTGDARLADGLRDLYAAAPDGTGAWFLAFVAPDGARVMISDIDGTLTSSENAFPVSTVVGTGVGMQPGAADAFARAAAAGITPIFVTSRGDLYTQSTRSWLDAHGFPRAPMHLSVPAITLPGKASIDFKRAVIAPFIERFDIAAAIGNRASDVTAYTEAGIAPDRIWIKLPEFADELTAMFARHEATGFYEYSSLSF